MGAVQPRIKSAELIGEDHHIPIIRFGDERKFFDMNEIFGLRQRSSDLATGVGSVGDEIFVLDPRYSGIFYTELLIVSKGAVRFRRKERRGIGNEAESIVAVGQPDDRSSGAQMGTEEHHVVALVLHHCRIVNGLYRIGNVGFGQYWILAISPDNIALHDSSLLADRRSFRRRARMPRPWPP